MIVDESHELPKALTTSFMESELVTIVLLFENQSITVLNSTICVRKFFAKCATILYIPATKIITIPSRE